MVPYISTFLDLHYGGIWAVHKSFTFHSSEKGTLAMREMINYLVYLMGHKYYIRGKLSRTPQLNRIWRRKATLNGIIMFVVIRSIDGKRGWLFFSKTAHASQMSDIFVLDREIISFVLGLCKEQNLIMVISVWN